MDKEAFRKLLVQWANEDVYIGQLTWEEGDALAEYLAKWYAASTSKLGKQAYELCLAIEQLPASEYQTKLSIMASDLLQNIRAAQQGVQRIGLYCAACGSELGENDACPRMCSQDTPNR